MVSANTANPANRDGMKWSNHVAFCGGGSGGHLFPGLAIAEELLLRHPSTQLTFLTSARDVDQRVLDSASLPEGAANRISLPLITSTGRIRYAIAVFRAFLQCRKEFAQSRPDAVVGLGGFASVPGVLAAARLKIPIVLLEVNAVPGAANRFLSRFAKITFGGWPVDAQQLNKWKSPFQQVGVPLRRSIRDSCRKTSPKPTLLILGGSQGASQVNTMVAEAISKSCGQLADWKIIHQTGPRDAAAISTQYSDHGVSVDVVTFIDDMAQALASAHVVISRCGAVSLAEIAASGCSSVLIPLSSSADGHQLKNAECFSVAGRGLIVDEDSPESVAELTRALNVLCAEAVGKQQKITAVAMPSANTAVETITTALLEIAGKSS